MNSRQCKVCVTGGASYIGSSLVKQLLINGYTVHATLRNLDEESKVGLLKSFPHAETGLVLFKADIYDPDSFESAIQGCQFVFHVASPVRHSRGFQFKNMTEATVTAAKSIKMFCKRSRTVKRLIYVGTVIAASPLKEDGTGFKDVMDETCWTPLNLSVPYSNDGLLGYKESKTLTEKELLSDSDGSDLEVVSLALGLVGGDSVLPNTPESISVSISQLTDYELGYQSLRFIEELLGKIPLVHIDDVNRAFFLCMDKPPIHGRFLCASSYVSSAEMAEYYRQNYPEFHIKLEYLEVPKREIKWGSTKLLDQGFKYNYDMKTILDDCISYARKKGNLQH